MFGKKSESDEGIVLDEEKSIAMAKIMADMMRERMIGAMKANLVAAYPVPTALDLALHLDVCIASSRVLLKLMCDMQSMLILKAQKSKGSVDKEKIVKAVRLGIKVGDEIAKEYTPPLIEEFSEELDKGLVRIEDLDNPGPEYRFTMPEGEA